MYPACSHWFLGTLAPTDSWSSLIEMSVLTHPVIDSHLEETHQDRIVNTSCLLQPLLVLATSPDHVCPKGIIIVQFLEVVLQPTILLTNGWNTFLAGQDPARYCVFVNLNCV